MPKVNSVIVDEKGDLQVEFSCYEGTACRVEEDKLRRALAELGLAVQVEWLKPKSPQQIEAETMKERGRADRKVVKYER